ncbi:hypothetical protein Ga0074812_102165 [Parafrankia irregularis]|uniref:Uncharacterized protein n=1 Tax=Parafrankia irregularis TaxID=795642 RepID=A0A0S4QG56_9ACTN|nr:hypothetical protein Ga0074812_102165 [Parafrankia irregularis]
MSRVCARPAGRRRLRAQVTAPKIRRPRVGADEIEHVRLPLTGSDETDRRDDQAFREDLGRVGGHGARAHPAHVRVVGAGGGIADDLVTEQQRGYQSHIRQMVAAGERVVEHPHVTGLRPTLGDHPHGLVHRAEMDGHVSGLRDHPPAGVEERRRAVPPLLDVGRVGTADQQRPHLLRDAAHRTRQHRQGHRIHAPSFPPRAAAEPSSPRKSTSVTQDQVTGSRPTKHPNKTIRTDQAKHLS